MTTFEEIAASCETRGHTLTEGQGMPQLTIVVHVGEPSFGVTLHQWYGAAPDPSMEELAAWVERLHDEAEPGAST
jgi:hypothetical protein